MVPDKTRVPAPFFVKVPELLNSPLNTLDPLPEVMFKSSDRLPDAPEPLALVMLPLILTRLLALKLKLRDPWLIEIDPVNTMLPSLVVILTLPFAKAVLIWEVRIVLLVPAMNVDVRGFTVEVPESTMLMSLGSRSHKPARPTALAEVST